MESIEISPGAMAQDRACLLRLEHVDPIRALKPSKLQRARGQCTHADSRIDVNTYQENHGAFGECCVWPLSLRRDRTSNRADSGRHKAITGLT